MFVKGQIGKQMPGPAEAGTTPLASTEPPQAASRGSFPLGLRSPLGQGAHCEGGC